ncbi:MAG: Tm-1-like ATP-binding domain-containing protein [Planctomycetota bacterium]|nr:Tm-1-like ATP-binding domain-containing protein [Planctomycetota bacterium]
MAKAYVVGTCDTKRDELLYVKRLIEDQGVNAELVDLSTRPAGTAGDEYVDVTPEEVAEHHPEGVKAVLGLDDRGKAVTAMAEAFKCFVRTKRDIGGMLGLGGSGGTALIAPGMRALPIGVPKILVSTVASGNVGQYVGPSDICMMYSVVDIKGINRISRVVLGNAANAIAGMVAHQIKAARGDKPAVGLTMFGVTTPCVTRVVEALEKTYECLVFHATGTGGRSMEKLADSGALSGIVDITTTEVADLLVGGIFSAGDDRLGAVARTKLPYVGSLGALDMVNFGAMDTVPEKFKGRKLYVHNPQITLMRTTPEENKAMGEWIANKLNECEGPVRFLIPEKGVSAIDAADKPFHDPEADKALFEALEKTFKPGPKRKLFKLPLHINDDAFAAEAVKHFKDVMKR